MDQASERTNGLIPQPNRKRTLSSNNTSPLPLRERARERGKQYPVSVADSSSSKLFQTIKKISEPTISMADHGGKT